MARTPQSLNNLALGAVLYRTAYCATTGDGNPPEYWRVFRTLNIWYVWYLYEQLLDFSPHKETALCIPGSQAALMTLGWRSVICEEEASCDLSPAKGPQIEWFFSSYLTTSAPLWFHTLNNAAWVPAFRERRPICVHRSLLSSQSSTTLQNLILILSVLIVLNGILLQIGLKLNIESVLPAGITLKHCICTFSRIIMTI